MKYKRNTIVIVVIALLVAVAVITSQNLQLAPPLSQSTLQINALDYHPSFLLDNSDEEFEICSYTAVYDPTYKILKDESTQEYYKESSGNYVSKEIYVFEGTCLENNNFMVEDSIPVGDVIIHSTSGLPVCSSADCEITSTIKTSVVYEADDWHSVNWLAGLIRNAHPQLQITGDNLFNDEIDIVYCVQFVEQYLVPYKLIGNNGEEACLITTTEEWDGEI